MKETGTLSANQNNDASGVTETGCDHNESAILTQFQAELGSRSHWEVAGAGVP